MTDHTETDSLASMDHLSMITVENLMSDWRIAFRDHFHLVVPKGSSISIMFMSVEDRKSVEWNILVCTNVYRRIRSKGVILYFVKPLTYRVKRTCVYSGSPILVRYCR